MPFDVYVVFDPMPAGAIDRALALIDASPPHRVAIQVRAKGHSESEHRAALLRLAPSAAARSVSLFVNGHPSLARELGVGLHLPEAGPPISELQNGLTPLGVSCHDAEGLRRRAGADFAVLGPVAPVPNKAEPLGWARWAELAREAPMPVYALGGIACAEDVRAAKTAGARGVAVARAVMGHHGPQVLHALLSVS